MKGVCKWWKEDRGFGFIAGEDGQDYFVHYTAIQSKTSGKRNLVPLANVDFTPEKNVKGLKATNVRTAIE